VLAQLAWVDGGEGGKRVLGARFRETTLLNLAEITGSKEIMATCNYRLATNPHRVGILGAVKLAQLMELALEVGIYVGDEPDRRPEGARGVLHREPHAL
jgi:hypothetical protein